jgi:hypothetical protein
MDDCTIDSTSLRKIMQNHQYTSSSSKFRHWNLKKRKKREKGSTEIWKKKVTSV